MKQKMLVILPNAEVNETENCAYLRCTKYPPSGGTEFRPSIWDKGLGDTPESFLAYFLLRSCV